MDSLKGIAVVIVLVSLFLNGYFIKRLYYDKANIIVKEVEKIVEVIKWKTKVVVVNEPVERPTGEAEVLLSQIEKATPSIILEDYNIARDEQDNFVIPGNIKGKMTLAYLKYDLDMSLKANVVYRKRYDFKIGMMAGNYCYDGGDTIGSYTDIVIVWAPAKFWDWDTNFDVGLKGIAITESYSLYHNLDWHLGYGWGYRGNQGVMTGLSLRL